MPSTACSKHGKATKLKKIVEHIKTKKHAKSKVAKLVTTASSAKERIKVNNFKKGKN